MSALAEALEAWLAGDLRPEQYEELLAACRQDAAFIGRLAEQRAMAQLLADRPPEARALLDRLHIAIEQDRTSRRLKVVDGVRRRIADSPTRGQAAGAPSRVRRLPRLSSVQARLGVLSVLVLLSVLAVDWWWSGEPAVAQLQLSEGTISVLRAGRSLDLGAGAALYADDVIRTKERPARVCWPQGVELDLASASTLHLHAGAEQYLAHGRADVLVPSGTPFAVRTDTGTATVAGTRFRVEAFAAESRVLVREGAVRFAGRDVTAGQLVRSEDGGQSALMVPDPDCFLAWGFDDRTDPGRDDSGYGHHLELFGPQVDPGIHGSALLFDGEDDYAVADLQGVDFQQGFALSFWIRLDRRRHCWPINSKQGSWNGPAGFAVECNFKWLAFIGRGSKSIRSGRFDWDQEWYHVLVNWSSDRAVLYVDGHPISLDPRRSDADGLLPVRRRHQRVFLGHIDGQMPVDGSPQRFKGALDEVRLYGRVLTDAEIEALSQRRMNPE